MTLEEINEWMAHAGVRKGLDEVVAGLKAAASQTFTDEAREAIEDGIARVVSAHVHAHQWRKMYDDVVAMHHHEHTLRTQIEEQLTESLNRVAKLEGFA